MRSCRRSPAFSLLLVISLFLGWLALSSSASAFAEELEVIIATEAAVSMSAEDSFAEMFDHALQKEFLESDHEQGGETDQGGFNNSVTENQDNVFIISNPKSKYPVLQLDLSSNPFGSSLLPYFLLALGC